jgi:hypothetical protein
LKKKRELPLILEVMKKNTRQNYPWLGDKNLFLRELRTLDVRSIVYCENLCLILWFVQGIDEILTG